jgi:hypothetical protein
MAADRGDLLLLEDRLEGAPRLVVFTIPPVPSPT